MGGVWGQIFDYSQTFVQKKTRWTEKKYYERRAVLLDAIRDEWEDRQAALDAGEEERKKRLRELFKIRITEFDDSTWLDNKGADQDEQLHEQLEFYVGWSCYCINQPRFKIWKDVPLPFAARKLARNTRVTNSALNDAAASSTPSTPGPFSIN